MNIAIAFQFEVNEGTLDSGTLYVDVTVNNRSWLLTLEGTSASNGFHYVRYADEVKLLPAKIQTHGLGSVMIECLGRKMFLPCDNELVFWLARELGVEVE